ncbi:MAG: hypothetical protein U0350_27050 [Caldilineaceae bacterium]
MNIQPLHRLFSLGLALFLALMIITPVFADAPITVPVNSSFVLTDCGFPIILHTEGSVQVHKPGENEVDVFHLAVTYTNPANGKSLYTPNVGAGVTQTTQDGSTIVRYTGIITRIVLPGQGLVAAGIGQVVITFSSDPNVPPQITIHGQSDPFEGNIVQGICTALA